MNFEIKRLLPNEERGATMVEYALIASLIAVTCIAGVTQLGTSAKRPFQKASINIQNAGALNPE